MQLQCTAALTKDAHTRRKLPINKHHHLLHTRVDSYRRGGVATEDSPSVANCVGSQMTLCGAILYNANILFSPASQSQQIPDRNNNSS